MCSPLNLQKVDVYKAHAEKANETSNDIKDKPLAISFSFFIDDDKARVIILIYSYSSNLDCVYRLLTCLSSYPRTMDVSELPSSS